MLFASRLAAHQKYINNFNQYIQKYRGEKGEEKEDNKSILYIFFP